MPDLIAETPRTQLAVSRTKRLLAKAKGTAGPALTTILVELASAAAKKGLGI